MATPAPPAGAASTSTSFLDKVKFLQEHLKLILTLATGSLILSVSLLQHLGSEFKGRNLLRVSWLWLFVSVLAGVACNYLLTLHLNSKENCYAPLVTVVSFVLHVCFAVAMVYFLRFALATL